MKKDQHTFTDSEGKVWLTPARVAEIWNERAKSSTYTRWSVYQRRKKLERIQTPLGDFYSEDVAWKTPLRPHPERPDVAQRNRDRKSQPENA